IMGVLLLAAPQGSALEIVADGDDEEAAIAALAELVDAKFDED
ncbi:MAG: HPr family phosphocarrier protein, partial [Acidobacteria bacterium]|nr:HPr family phosphocarrier protein [Acidobacteriota bacterium]